jgi:hypothetical protein
MKNIDLEDSYEQRMALKTEDTFSTNEDFNTSLENNPSIISVHLNVNNDGHLNADNDDHLNAGDNSHSMCTVSSDMINIINNGLNEDDLAFNQYNLNVQENFITKEKDQVDMNDNVSNDDGNHVELITNKESRYSPIDDNIHLQRSRIASSALSNRKKDARIKGI